MVMYILLDPFHILRNDPHMGGWMDDWMEGWMFRWMNEYYFCHMSQAIG